MSNNQMEDFSETASSGDSQRACDACNAKKVKCIVSDGDCRRCLKNNVSCTFIRPVSKKGPAVGKHIRSKGERIKRLEQMVAAGKVETIQDQQTILNIISGLDVPWLLPAFPDDPLPNEETCNHLMTTFVEHVLPMYPILTGQIDNLLLYNASLCLASRFSWLPTSNNPIGMVVSRKMAKSIFSRARQYIPISLMHANLQTVQGLIVMLFSIVAHGGQSHGWTWTGATATSLAHVLMLDSIEYSAEEDVGEERVKAETWNCLFDLDVNASTIFVTRPMLNPTACKSMDIKGRLMSLFSAIMHNRASPDIGTLLQLTADLTAMEPLLDMMGTECLQIILLHGTMTTFLEGPMLKPGASPRSTDPHDIFSAWYCLPSFPLMYRAAQRCARLLKLDKQPKALSVRGSDLGIGLFRLAQVVLAHGRFTRDANDDLLLHQIQKVLIEHGDAWIVSKQLGHMLTALSLLSKAPSATSDSRLVALQTPNGHAIHLRVPEIAVENVLATHQVVDEIVQESLTFLQG